MYQRYGSRNSRWEPDIGKKSKYRSFYWMNTIDEWYCWAQRYRNRQEQKSYYHSGAAFAVSQLTISLWNVHIENWKIFKSISYFRYHERRGMIGLNDDFRLNMAFPDNDPDLPKNLEVKQSNHIATIDYNRDREQQQQ